MNFLLILIEWLCVAIVTMAVAAVFKGAGLLVLYPCFTFVFAALAVRKLNVIAASEPDDNRIGDDQ